MAQELIGGATFTLLYDGVKKALDETATFKYLLKDLKFTLESLTRLRTTAIQQIGVYNVELGLPNEEIEDLERRMEEGAKLVEKLSNSRLWKWNYCCISCYIDQLVDLDRALRRLLENLKLQEARDVKELLELSRNQRNNHKELDEVKGLLLNIEKLLQQKEEDVMEALASGRNTETIPDPNEGNGGEQVALLEGVDALRAAFGMLFDAVKEVKDKNKMFKPLLVYLKSTLDCLKPLIEEIAQHNKVLNLPKEELKNFRIQMEKGVELIHNCSKVRLWASYKKHKYTDKLLGLDESLQTLLHILKMQVARDVNVVPAISNIEAVIKQIEGSGVVQNQIQTKGLCAVPKPSLPTVQLDALGVQGTRDVNEASVLITNITEVGVMQIEGSDVVQNHNEIKGESGNDSRNRVSNTSSSAGRSPFLETESLTESLRMDQSQTDWKVLEKSNLRAFSFAELKASTRKFRPEAVVGEGGFGKVFKGWVNEKTLAPSKPFKGMTVAIKKFNPQSVQGFPEWQSEVNFLGKVSHPNLIKLLGYSTEKEDLLLVYEFMPRGSLGNQLFTRSATIEPLSWDNRLKIAIEAAQGLAFLHTLEEQVIHRNIKSSTILLDGNYNAKISGLGLAKLGPTDGESHVSTAVMGTLGYAAPEYVAKYVATGYLNVKSDLYSFGVVLLEILTGLRVIDKNRPREQHNLVKWAKPLLSHKRKLKTIMDVRIEGQYSFKAALQTAHVTLKCLERDPKKRPSMKEVVEALQQIQAINGKPKQSKLTSKQSS